MYQRSYEIDAGITVMTCINKKLETSSMAA